MKNKKVVIVILVCAVLMISFGFIYLIVFSNKKTNPKKETVEEKYQDERISKIIKKEDVKKSKNIITAKELYTMLREREIIDFIFVDVVYDMNGEQVEDLTIINKDSTEKYPMYYLSYKVPTTGNVWTITVIGNSVTAFPKDKPDSTICLTESEEFMSYSPEENKLYYVTPNKEMFDIKIVDKIDAKTIAEEDQKLGNN